MKTNLLALSALAAAVLALSGCGKPAETSSTTATGNPDPTASAPANAPAGEEDSDDDLYDTGEPKQLNLFCWSEYVPQSVIDRFTKQTGIKVNVENYSSNEEMLAKVLSGGGEYDLLQPSEYIVEALIAEGLLRPIDHKLIRNIKNLDPLFTNLPFDPGNKYSVPWMAGTVGIVVNTDLVKDDIKSYNDVFQQKFKDRIVVLDDAREIVSWGLETLDIPVNDITDENLEKVKPVLKEWLPLVSVFDSDSPKTAMLNGDTAIGIVWNGEGAKLLESDPKFKWIIPAEGAHLFVDSLVIPKNAKHPKNAELFMNFILRPKVSTLISDDFPYTNPNAAARKLLKPEQLGNAAAFPTSEEIAKMQTFKDIGTQASKIDDLVTTLKVQ